MTINMSGTIQKNFHLVLCLTILIMVLNGTLQSECDL